MTAEANPLFLSACLVATGRRTGRASIGGWMACHAHAQCHGPRRPICDTAWLLEEEERVMKIIQIMLQMRGVTLPSVRQGEAH